LPPAADCQANAKLVPAFRSKHSGWRSDPEFHHAANQPMIRCLAVFSARTRSPEHSRQDRHTVNRTNLLFLIIGALVIVAAVLGYELYQDRKQPEGMQINVGPNGLSIEKK
jgi:hypothetical protein